MSPVPRSSVSIVLFVAALVVAAGFAVPPADPASTVAGQEETPTPTPAPSGTAMFTEGSYLTTPNESVEIGVQLQDVEEATVRFGDETTAYDANVTVVDGDGDANVTLVFDPAASGEGMFSAAADGDEVTVESQEGFEDANLVNVPITAMVEGVETAAATVLIRAEDPATLTPTPTATPTPTPTPDETPTATSTPGNGGDGNGENTPGFGLVAALVAIVIAALVAVRRR